METSGTATPSAPSVHDEIDEVLKEINRLTKDDTTRADNEALSVLEQKLFHLRVQRAVEDVAACDDVRMQLFLDQNEHWAVVARYVEINQFSAISPASSLPSAIEQPDIILEEGYDVVGCLVAGLEWAVEKILDDRISHVNIDRRMKTRFSYIEKSVPELVCAVQVHISLTPADNIHLLGDASVAQIILTKLEWAHHFFCRNRTKE